MPHSDSEILTVQEVARLLKVTPKTVYGLVKKGSLRSFRVGRVVRCTREDVETFIEQSANAPTQASEDRP